MILGMYSDLLLYQLPTSCSNKTTDLSSLPRQFIQNRNVLESIVGDVIFLFAALERYVERRRFAITIGWSGKEIDFCWNPMHSPLPMQRNGVFDLYQKHLWANTVAAFGLQFNHYPSIDISTEKKPEGVTFKIHSHAWNSAVCVAKISSFQFKNS